MDDDRINVILGIPILHSKDKKEVCYLGRNQTQQKQNYPRERDMGNIGTLGTSKELSDPMYRPVSSSNKSIY